MTHSINDLSALLAMQRFNIVDEAAMQAFGARLAMSLPQASLVTLSGELGAGKSVLARAMIHSLGYQGRVKSPTYTLIETYEVVDAGKVVTRIAHLDLYRLTDPEELDYLGFDDVLATHDLVIIEWPEQAEGRVPAASVHVLIEYAIATSGTQSEHINSPESEDEYDLVAEGRTLVLKSDEKLPITQKSS